MNFFPKGPWKAPITLFAFLHFPLCFWILHTYLGTRWQNSQTSVGFGNFPRAQMSSQFLSKILRNWENVQSLVTLATAKVRCLFCLGIQSCCPCTVALWDWESGSLASSARQRPYTYGSPYTYDWDWRLVLWLCCEKQLTFMVDSQSAVFHTITTTPIFNLNLRCRLRGLWNISIFWWQKFRSWNPL